MTRRTAWKSGTPEAALLSGATVVDPRAGLHGELDVHISDGKIVSVSEAGTAEVPADCQVIDCSGQILMPAFTDPHVHFRTPGQEHKETISSGTAAAAAGGYCLVLAMPNTTPTVDGAEILRGILARAEQEAVIPMGQLGAITKGLGGLELTEMAQMTEAGAAGFTDDGIPVTDAGVLRKALRYQQVTGAVIALHEEDPSLSLGAPLNEGLVSAKLGLRGQPGVAESTMISRDCELAELENAVIHVQHVSSGGSVRVIREAKARGVKVTAEASPHHLLLTDEACSTLDSRAKMNPPLRSEADRQAVIVGLVDGTLDCIATDHAPHHVDEKEQPFEDAPFGTTGLETSFAAIYDELVVRSGVSLDLIVERMTSGCIPFGFEAPSIAPGHAANLTVFDPGAEWVVGSDGWASSSSNSCFAGRRLCGRIVRTFVEGVQVYKGGSK